MNSREYTACSRDNNVKAPHIISDHPYVPTAHTNTYNIMCNKAERMRSCCYTTHRPTLVKKKEQVHEIDYQKHHIPDHHIQVASVQSCPCNEEATSCKR